MRPRHTLPTSVRQPTSRLPAFSKQATEEADEQINERREAAKSELEGVQQRIADLQTREAQITQRVSELRAMFANAFSGFGANRPVRGQFHRRRTA